MYNMNEITIEKLKSDNAKIIVDWCKDRDEDFLRQWAGAGYSYPLTAEQICGRLAEGAQIFEAHRGGEMVGTIEIIEIDEQNNSALVGRFVLDQTVTGKGIGSEVMTAFLGYCKEKLGLSQVTLFVFDFNIGAHKCYQKCGFCEIGRVERPNGWIAINMKKTL